MGFKYKKFTFVGGSESFPTGNSEALRQQRSKEILKNAAEALIATDTGWILDSSRNATTSDFSSVPCMSGSKTFPGLFFINSMSGCKLFMAYFGGSHESTDVINNFGDNNNLYYLSSTTSSICGLIVSIIPSGSFNSFGASFNSDFLPQDATRLVGTCFYTSVGSFYTTHAFNPTSGDKYTWGILATPFVVGVGSSKSDGISSPVYITGRIFGELAHNEDKAVNAKYGTVFFRMTTSNGVTEGWSGDISSNMSYFGGTSTRVPGRPTDNGNISANNCCGVFSKPDGTWVNGTNGSSYIVLLITSNPFLLSNKVFSANSNTWWQPLLMLVMTNDLSTYNVVPGDGFKGYLDTDLFRCGLGDYGTLFDNGNFIKANEDIYNNLILGWSLTGNDPY